MSLSERVLKSSSITQPAFYSLLFHSPQSRRHLSFTHLGSQQNFIILLISANGADSGLRYTTAKANAKQKCRACVWRATYWVGDINNDFTEYSFRSQSAIAGCTLLHSPGAWTILFVSPSCLNCISQPPHERFNQLPLDVQRCMKNALFYSGIPFKVSAGVEITYRKDETWATNAVV